MSRISEDLQAFLAYAQLLDGDEKGESQVFCDRLFQAFGHAGYTFGILQSSLHWVWFQERCSTLKSDPRYTSNTVFDSFPWPQAPSRAAAKAVAAAAVALRAKRRELCEKHNISLRKLYASMEQPGNHPLKDATAALDTAVRKAYGMTPTTDPLKHLLALNLELAAAELDGKAITGPGLPPCVTDASAFVTEDAIKPQAAIEAMVISAFAARARSRALLAAAKRAVEIAIEQGEAEALAWLAR